MRIRANESFCRATDNRFLASLSKGSREELLAGCSFHVLPVGEMLYRAEERARRSEEIRSRLLECVQEETYTLSQVAGCNRLHAAEERLARWLLMAQDRTGSPQLNFTQEFLGQMLALQRTTISVVAGSLHDAGLIDYRRGKLTVLDRPGLESAACSCYPTTQSLFNGMYRKPWYAMQETPKHKPAR